MKCLIVVNVYSHCISCEDNFLQSNNYTSRVDLTTENINAQKL